ncbi:hypothetical protein H6P81_000155 [Aristolochia fimbriata]|uniref:Transmembrane protein n=1 Tax=Aristolochia fimbriata TaxID=158543 RepID=A0AAV7F3G9_ARIFI|nr:hypothetical protein H6P81_000155 [Aristolochia fimbriata]
MGRRLPTESDPLLHPALITLSIHVVFMAAVVAVVASLCGNRGKKSSKSESSSNRAGEDGNNNAETTPTADAMGLGLEEEESQKVETPTEEVPLYPLPLPQSLRPLPEGHRVPPMKSASTRHLKVSLSVKMPSKITRIRTTAREHRLNKKTDDCIWKKTIILGEKCRVPSVGDEEDFVFDENGNKIVPYTPRTPRSLPVSRSVSLIDQDAVPDKNS